MIVKTHWSTILISLLIAAIPIGCQQSDGNAAVVAVLETELGNYSVQDMNGKSIGAVQGLVMDRNSGAVSYVIVHLSQPPFNGKVSATQPDAPVAIPWSELHLDADGKTLVFWADTVILADAPRLASNLTDLSNGWDNEIHRYWDPLPER